MKKTLQMLFALFFVATINAQTVGETFVEGGVVYEYTAIGTGASGDEHSAKAVYIDSVNIATITSITIPATITNSNGGTNITGMNEFAFQQNPYLTSVTIEAALPNVPRQAFYECPELTTVALNNPSIVQIRRAAFQNCVKLETINLENIDFIDWNGLRGCVMLNNDDINNTTTGLINLTNAGRGCIQLNTGVTEIILPKVVSLGQDAVGSSSLEVLRLGPDLTSIHDQGFDDLSACYAIEMQAATPPPSFSTIAFNGGDKTQITVYVPNETIRDAYLASEWGDNLGTTGLKAIVVGSPTLSTKKVEAEALGFNVYPNPTNDVVSIKNSQVKDANITVYDVNGRALLNQNINTPEAQINLSGFSKGIYIFRVQTANSEFTKRIIKQ